MCVSEVVTISLNAYNIRKKLNTLKTKQEINAPQFGMLQSIWYAMPQSSMKKIYVTNRFTMRK